MQSSANIIVLVGVIVVCVAIFVAVTIVFVQQALRRAQRELDAALGGQPVMLRDNMANFFGLQSLGPVQVRGNGSLALTRDTLAFKPALSKRPPLMIPRSAIQKVESTRSHLGKNVGRPLLAVHFTTSTGEADVVAWLVRDLNRWLAEIGR